MRPSILISLLLVSTACVKKQEVSIRDHTEVKLLQAASSLDSFGLNVDVAMTYRRPLKAPFNLYADVRCKEPGGAFEVHSILRYTTSTNMLPDESTKIDFYWKSGMNFSSQKESICKIRVFSAQRPFERPQDEEESYDILAQWCLKSESKPNENELNFVLSEPKLCQ